MTQTEDRSEAQEGSLNGLMLVVAVVSAVSGLLYGYDTGIISGALLQISEEFSLGNGLEQAIAAGILLGRASVAEDLAGQVTQLDLLG